MIERRPIDIDMRADGSFVEKPRPEGFSQGFAGWPPPPRGSGGSLVRTLTIAAVIAGSIAVAGVVLSLALVLVPVLIGAALIGYAALRFQLWRMRKTGATMRGPLGPIIAQVDVMMRSRRRGS